MYIFKDNHIYKVEKAPRFVLFRKGVIFNKKEQLVVLKEIEGLEFLTKRSLSDVSTTRFLEITAYDAVLIREAMGISND